MGRRVTQLGRFARDHTQRLGTLVNAGRPGSTYSERHLGSALAATLLGLLLTGVLLGGGAGLVAEHVIFTALGHVNAAP